MTLGSEPVVPLPDWMVIRLREDHATTVFFGYSLFDYRGTFNMEFIFSKYLPGQVTSELIFGQSSDMGTIMTPTVQMEQLRHREVK